MNLYSSPYCSPFSTAHTAPTPAGASRSRLPQPSGPAPVEATRLAAYQVDDRVLFFGGRRSTGAQLYTITARSWQVNPLVAGGYGWYYKGQATGPGGLRFGPDTRWISEQFVALATL